MGGRKKVELFRANQRRRREHAPVSVSLILTALALLMAGCRSLPWAPSSTPDEESLAIADGLDVPVEAVPHVEARLSVDVGVFEAGWKAAYPGRYAGSWWDRSGRLPVLHVAFKGQVDPTALRLDEVGVPVVLRTVTLSLDDLEALKDDVIRAISTSKDLAEVVRSVGPDLPHNVVVVGLEDSDRGREKGRELAKQFLDRRLSVEYTDFVFRF